MDLYWRLMLRSFFFAMNELCITGLKFSKKKALKGFELCCAIIGAYIVQVHYT